MVSWALGSVGIVNWAVIQFAWSDATPAGPEA